MVLRHWYQTMKDTVPWERRHRWGGSDDYQLMALIEVPGRGIERENLDSMQRITYGDESKSQGKTKQLEFTGQSIQTGSVK